MNIHVIYNREQNRPCSTASGHGRIIAFTDDTEAHSYCTDTEKVVVFEESNQSLKTNLCSLIENHFTHYNGEKVQVSGVSDLFKVLSELCQQR